MPGREIFELLYTAIVEIGQVILDRISSIADFSFIENAINTIVAHTVWSLHGVLPDQSEMIENGVNAAVNAFRSSVEWLSLLDYVIHVPWLIVFISLALAIEIGMVPVHVIVLVGKALNAIPFV